METGRYSLPVSSMFFAIQYIVSHNLIKTNLCSVHMIHDFHNSIIAMIIPSLQMEQHYREKNQQRNDFHAN